MGTGFNKLYGRTKVLTVNRIVSLVKKVIIALSVGASFLIDQSFQFSIVIFNTIQSFLISFHPQVCKSFCIEC